MKLNKKTLAVSVATLVIIGGTSAFAWLSAGGSGTGTGTTGDATPTISVVNAMAGHIVELDVPVPVYVELTADKNGAHIDGLAVAVDTTSQTAVDYWAALDGTGNNPKCLPAWFSGSTVSGLDTDVPKTTDTIILEGNNLPPGSTGDLTLTLTLQPEDQNGCLNLSDIPLTITVS